MGVDLVTTQRSGPQTAGLPRGGWQELWGRGEGAAERRVWEPASHCVAVGLRLAFCPSIRLARVRAARSCPVLCVLRAGAAAVRGDELVVPELILWSPQNSRTERRIETGTSDGSTCQERQDHRARVGERGSGRPEGQVPEPSC